MDTIIKHVTFHIHTGDQTLVFTEVDLDLYAHLVGLDAVAPNRYSWLFVLQLFLQTQRDGIDATVVVDEIKALEGQPVRIHTKPASQFKSKPLRGLWHKHFFSGRFVAQNIWNQLAGGRLEALVKEVCSPEKSAVLTAEMVSELSHRATVDAIETRDSQGKLTGEWIVFAKHGEKNYYLTVSTHNAGDHSIYKQVESVCFPQFPFLRPNVVPDPGT